MKEEASDVQILAAWEIFACICNGGTLVMRGSKWEPVLHEVSSFTVPGLLTGADNSHKINVLICTPTILSRHHPDTYPQIKVVATAGEPSSQKLVAHPLALLSNHINVRYL